MNRSFKPAESAPSDRTTAFDRETINAMALAFDKVSDAFGVHVQVDPELTKAIAAKIVELAIRGERDVDRLSALTLLTLSNTQI